MSLDHATSIVNQAPSRDAFLGGRLTLLQPARGFRAGLDSVLLGAAVGVQTGRLLDLGAGVGTAGLVALRYHAGLSALLVDNDVAALDLARQNIVANDFVSRVEAVALDIAAPGAARVSAGLGPDAFSAVIANPPFFTAGQGTLAKGARAPARHMGGAFLDRWAQTAAAHAAPGGEVIFILPAESLAALLAAFEPRLGALTLLPFAPRPGEPASRILLRGIKGSRAPLKLLATRSLHGPDGAVFAPDIEPILRGEVRLLW